MILPGIKGFIAPVSGGGGGSDPYFASVTLLMHGDGTPGATSTVDSSSYARTISAAGSPLPTLSSTQAKFGATSMAFTGSGNSAFTCAASADTQFGTGDFTIEFWAYNTSLTNAPYFIANRRSSTGLGWYINSSSAGVLNFGIDGVGTISTGSGAVVTGQWQHIAVTRASGTIRLFVGGVGATSSANSSDFQIVDRVLSVGRDNSSGNNVNGYIDDFRITKGVARYTANFTPPTSAFPDS